MFAGASGPRGTCFSDPGAQRGGRLPYLSVFQLSVSHVWKETSGPSEKAGLRAGKGP